MILANDDACSLNASPAAAETYEPLKPMNHEKKGTFLWHEMSPLSCAPLLFHHFLKRGMSFQLFCHSRHAGEISDENDAAQAVVQEIVFSVLFLAHILEFHRLVEQVRVLAVVACRLEGGIHTVEGQSRGHLAVFQTVACRIGSGDTALF